MATHSKFYQYARSQGRTIKYYAERAGLNSQQLNLYTNHHRIPNLDTAVHLARSWGMPLEQLAGLLLDKSST